MKRRDSEYQVLSCSVVVAVVVAVVTFNGVLISLSVVARELVNTDEIVVTSLKNKNTLSLFPKSFHFKINIFKSVKVITETLK